MKDLTFIDEGNPDWVKVNNVKLINFAKRRMIYNLIFNSVLRFQQFKYDIETEDDLQEVINHLPKLEENILEEQSLKIEPRNAARVDLR
jgi:2-phospho-L-lactate guanylyltransferase (CobY/MobA/RfbA family)